MQILEFNTYMQQSYTLSACIKFSRRDKNNILPTAQYWKENNELKLSVINQLFKTIITTSSKETNKSPCI